MKNEYKAHDNTKFIVLEHGIELRENDGTHICTVCCDKCVKQLEKAIWKFKTLNKMW